MMQLKDELLKVTKALPAGAASTTSDSIDTGKSSRGEHAARCELLLTYPDLTLLQLPNTKTMTYQILGSDSADLSNPTITATLVTQTGATGTDPCPGGTVRYRPPSDGPRYWGAKATGLATGDGSGSSMTLQMVF